jgi:hypothetical protein
MSSVHCVEESLAGLKDTKAFKGLKAFPPEWRRHLKAIEVQPFMIQRAGSDKWRND